MRTRFRIASLFAVLGLVACGGQSGPESAVAQVRALDSTPSSDGPPSMIQCADSFADYNPDATWFLRRSGTSGNIDPQLGVDGDFNTFTTAAWADQDGVDVVYSVRPQSGVVFPGGTTSGFWMAREQANNGLFIRSVRTRLNGEVQDEKVSNELNGNQFNLSLIPSYFGVRVTKPFDELVVQFEGGARLSDMRIFEACIDR